jgi:hypothetical protein
LVTSLYDQLSCIVNLLIFLFGLFGGRKCTANFHTRTSCMQIIFASPAVLLSGEYASHTCNEALVHDISDQPSEQRFIKQIVQADHQTSVHVHDKA